MRQHVVFPRQARATLEAVASAKENSVARGGQRSWLASFTALLNMCATYMPDTYLNQIVRAYEVARAAHGKTRRKSGELFIEHPIAVATILAELAVDAPGIAAALLHDTIEDTDLRLDELARQFGPIVAHIVDGVTKFTAFEGTDKAAKRAGVQISPPGDPVLDVQAMRERKARQQVETTRKLMLALAQDPRVVLLKLADRLHNLRTMSSMAPATREHKSRETLDIYAPLAGRIGLHVFKSELEDLAYSYLQPETYAVAASALHAESERLHEWAEAMSQTMRAALWERGIDAAVNWRVKHPYRAYEESSRSGMDITQLHDVFAFRVLVESTDQCYQALGVVHHLWQPVGDRTRDYIASPKQNGYQSLHTTVFAPGKRLTQVHIRTHAMHRTAQHGLATYWLEHAERGEYVEFGPDVWLNQMPRWVPQIEQWQSELKLSADEFVHTMRNELFQDQVFVFTPKGQIRDLPAGATVLDLAYAIHSRIGDHAEGAFVQYTTRDGIEGRTEPVSYVLRSGDIVKVLTDPGTEPQLEWLASASTRYARHRISRAVRQRERAHESDSPRLEIEPTAESEPEPVLPLRHPSRRQAMIRLAQCCSPCPGDAIAGLADSGRLVTIHRTCCRTLQITLTRRKQRGAIYAEAMPVQWDELGPMQYRLRLAIYGQDHQGLVHEVSSCVADLGLSVSGIQAVAHPERYKAAIALTVEMPPNARRDVVLRRLRSVPGVIQIERDTSKGCR